MSLYYGPCQDWPYDGKPMAHGVDTCRVAIHTMKAVPDGSRLGFADRNADQRQ